MKFDFDDINLIPQKCVVESRSECDTSITFGRHKFRLPVVPANMECVITEELSMQLAKNGYFYVMHRFDVDNVSFTKKMKELNLISSISIGVNADSYKMVDDLKSSNLEPDYITIDIAHGHSIKMKRMIEYVKTNLPNSFVIAGNISTKEAVIEMTAWGADALKVGIGPGSSCTTYPSTGFGSRNCQASTIELCSNVSCVPIVADGGIKLPGDISKSIVLGASMVMIGGVLSGFKDSPGHVLEVDGKKYKEFWGSASSHQSGKTNRIEGKRNLTPLKDKSIFDELVYLEECLQSSISYGGGKELNDLNKVKYL